MSTSVGIIAVIYFLWLVGIVVLANSKGTQHFVDFGVGIPYFDKIAHFVLMGGLSLLVNLALKVRKVKLLSISYLLGSVAVLVIVTIEEASQIFVRGRAFDLGDLVADYLGIIIFGEFARFICGEYVVK